MDRINQKQLFEFIDKVKDEDGVVDVAQLASLLDIKVFGTDFTDSPTYNSFLYYDTTSGKTNVYINSSNLVRVQRYSIAYEIAKYILKGLDYSSYLNNKTENKINNLAREILLPSSSIEMILKRFGVKIEDYISDEIVNLLVKTFKVSDVVMIMRLVELNYKVNYICYA